MLGELQALRLVGRADALPIELIRPRQHVLEDEAADRLPVLQNERHLARAHFQHGARPAPAGPGIAETGVEEAGVMDAEFADERVERHHLGGVVGRHLDGLLGGEDVELVRVEDQRAFLVGADRLPELADLVGVAAVDIDHAGVALGAISDQPVRSEPGQVDADRDALIEVGAVLVNQSFVRMQVRKRVAQEDGAAPLEAHLRQARAFAHEYREGARADLEIERAAIAGFDMVEGARVVGDHPREHVEPAGRAFRIGRAGDVGREREALHQGDDVDAARLQHRAVAQRDRMQFEVVDSVCHGRPRPRKEARAHAKGDLAETQVEARRLRLVRRDRRGRDDPARSDEREDHAVGQDAPIGSGKGERHGRLR